jgi:WD40 repeat protein
MLTSSKMNRASAQAGTVALRSMNPFPDLPDNSGGSLVRRAQAKAIKPVWHAPWKLMRVISGHLGWVRSVTVEPGNKWFATGAGDRTIKVTFRFDSFQLILLCFNQKIRFGTWLLVH